MRKATIILPTYNEKDNIVTLIPAIFKIAATVPNWRISVLVVDDQSPDHTFASVQKLEKQYPDLHLIQGKKKGLGNAYFRGFAYAIETINPDVIFEMDADWSHSPKLIPQFLGQMAAGADFVIGSRYIKGGSVPRNWRFDRKLFSILGNMIVKYGFMTIGINDWTSGYRCIKAWFLKDIMHQMTLYNGYVFQVALLDRAHKRGLAIAEIPLHFKDREKGKSKIQSTQYIINTLLYVFFNSSFVRFVIVGTTSFLIDFSISFLLIEKIKLAIWISTIFSGEISIMANFLINNFWSFSHKRIGHKFLNYLTKFAHFNFVAAGSVVIQTIGLSITTIFFPRQWWFIYKIFIIVLLIIPYSYFMYNFVIWKKEKRS